MVEEKSENRTHKDLRSLVKDGHLLLPVFSANSIQEVLSLFGSLKKYVSLFNVKKATVYSNKTKDRSYNVFLPFFRHVFKLRLQDIGSIEVGFNLNYWR